MATSNQTYIAIGQLVSLLEQLADRHGISLPRPTLGHCVIADPYSIVPTLARVTRAASDKEYTEISRLVSLLDAPPPDASNNDLATFGAGKKTVRNDRKLDPQAAARTMRALRLERHLSQTAAAIACGLTPQYWSKMEAAKMTPGLNKLNMIASGLGIAYVSLIARIQAAGD